VVVVFFFDYSCFVLFISVLFSFCLCLCFCTPVLFYSVLFWVVVVVVYIFVFVSRRLEGWLVGFVKTKSLQYLVAAGIFAGRKPSKLVLFF